jgi:hypothetical protein
VARAKQTDRAEVRRRHRLAAAAQDVETDDGAELDFGERKPGSGPKPAAGRQSATADRNPPGRTGFLDAFRQAYHPVHLREDLGALPQIFGSRGFLAATALLLLGGAAWLLFPLRSGSAIAWELLVVPGSALAPQLLGGFFAPRASYLIGFVLGVLQTVIFVLVTLSPPVAAAYQALQPGGGPDLSTSQVLSALVSSAVTGALFAAAAAWYRRFLALSSPRRTPARPAPRRSPNRR